MDGQGPSRVVRMSLAGGGTTPIATGLGFPEDIVSDDQYVYFVFAGSTAGIRKIASGSTTVLPYDLTGQTPQVNDPGPLAADGTDLYFAEVHSFHAYRMLKAGSGPPVILDSTPLDLNWP